MSAANRMSDIVKKRLSELAKETKQEVTWKTGGPRFGQGSVDVVGWYSGKPVILIEIERRRAGPSTNVIKIWRWAEDGKLSGDTLVLQAFSKFFDKGSGVSKKAHALFVGEHLRSQCPHIHYTPISFGYNPRAKAKSGAGAMKKHSVELAEEIWPKIRRFLKRYNEAN